MNTIKFYSDLNQLVHKICSQWKHILPIVLISILWYSCEQEPIVEESHSTEMETPNDLSDLLPNLNFDIGNSNFVSLSIDTLDIDRGINTRSSTCDVDISITKGWGNATKYDVLIYSVGDSIVYFDDSVLPGTFGSNSETVEDIDDSKSYNIRINPDPGSSSERFSFRITTPSLAYTYTFVLDTTTNEEGEIDGFNHFDCP